MKIKCLSKLADKMLYKRGYVKEKETELYVSYKQPHLQHQYTSILALSHNRKHPNSIMCYEEKVNSDGFNNADSIPNNLLLPIILKMISKGFMFDNKNKSPWE